MAQLMNQRLRILHLEDEPDFCDLVHSLLEKEGLDNELAIACTRAEFEQAVERQDFDLILADYHLPDYDGTAALKLAKEKCPQIPFLLVSGTIGEQAAIESLKAGATDYVLKMWPDRLAPAVRRAVEEAEEKRTRRRVETELIQRERHFRESEQQYRLIFDGNPTPMWVFDQETMAFLEVNDAAVQHYGYTREEFLRMHITAICPVQEVPAMIEYVNKLISGANPSKMGLAGVWRHRKKDGCLIDVEIKWSPVTFRGRRASLTMANDITERRGMEFRDAALSKLGQSLSSATSPEEAAEIIRAIADDLFHWDAFTLDLYSEETDQVYPILNVDTDRSGKRLVAEVTGESRPPSGRARRVIASGAELVLREEPIEMPADSVPFGDLSRPSVSLMLVPIRNRTKVIGLLSIQSYKLKAYTQQDLITLQALADHCGGALERIRAEAALHESELLFHSVWQNSVDGMRLTDEAGNIVAVNHAFCKLVGMSREELQGRSFTVIYAESENPRQILETYCQRFQQRITDHQLERTLILRNGASVTLEDTNCFVDLGGGAPLLLGLFRDVTSQKQLEEQLRQSQKMEAIGQLAGGVAHDFNNILTVIQGHASLLGAGAKLTGVWARSAQQIGQAAERATGLTRQLLAFSRRQVMKLRCLDMNQVVSNMNDMLARLLGEDIALQISHSGQPALVQADSSMLEQVLLNLAVNARDAMPKGGQLALRISVVELQTHPLPRHPEAQAGTFVCLTASDNGCGIARENLPRVFEPFFTTKEIGKGTGLGLATVYGIIKQHQGWIEVESEIEKGTTFKVFLPASKDVLRPAAEHPEERPVKGGTETILVVEDEAPVRELVCSLLERQGYRILQAESGRKALEVWKTSKNGIDLLLTDLVMPDRMNGRELAERLWAERPNLKVIFTSGYSVDVVGKDFVLRSGLNYLQKPYPPQKLALAVRDCLDAKN